MKVRPHLLFLLPLFLWGVSAVPCTGFGTTYCDECITTTDDFMTILRGIFPISQDTVVCIEAGTHLAIGDRASLSSEYPNNFALTITGVGLASVVDMSAINYNQRLLDNYEAMPVTIQHLAFENSWDTNRDGKVYKSRHDESTTFIYNVRVSDFLDDETGSAFHLHGAVTILESTFVQFTPSSSYPVGGGVIHLDLIYDAIVANCTFSDVTCDKGCAVSARAYADNVVVLFENSVVAYSIASAADFYYGSSNQVGSLVSLETNGVPTGVELVVSSDVMHDCSIGMAALGAFGEGTTTIVDSSLFYNFTSSIGTPSYYSSTPPYSFTNPSILLVQRYFSGPPTVLRVNDSTIFNGNM